MMLLELIPGLQETSDWDAVRHRVSHATDPPSLICT